MKESHKNDKSLFVFILPFAIIIFIGLSIWLLSLGWTTRVGFEDDGKSTAYVKGVVIKNVVSANTTSGNGYLEVLTPENDVATVYFENRNNGCSSVTAFEEAAAVKVGEKIVAFGFPVSDREIEVCSSAYYYIRDIASSTPYENWALYTDKNLGIEFNYPPNWKISTSTGAIGTITGIYAPSSVNPALEITMFTGARSFELAEWASQYYGTAAGVPQSTMLANVPAIVVPITEAGNSRNALLVKREDKMLQFVFPSSETKDKNLVALPALILRSVAFVNGSAVSDSKIIDSGIQGSVTIGPVCPVLQNPPSDECSDKPYEAKLAIFDKDGEIVMHFSTDKNGTFKISIEPGTYRIVNDSDSSLPRLSPTEVVVNPHVYTRTSLVFDSGIR